MAAQNAVRGEQAAAGVAGNAPESASHASATAHAAVGIASAARAHGIPDARVVSRTESEAVLDVHIPASSDYFDGHFPTFKLLPAVAQIDLVTDYARACFGTSKGIHDIKRCKFIAPLLPEADVRFTLGYNAGTISFKLTDCVSGAAYASGTLRA